MPWISQGLAGSVPWRAWSSAFLILAIRPSAAISASHVPGGPRHATVSRTGCCPLAIWMLSPLATLAAAKGFPALAPSSTYSAHSPHRCTRTLTSAEPIGWHVNPIRHDCSRTGWSGSLPEALSLAWAAALVSRGQAPSGCRPWAIEEANGTAACPAFRPAARPETPTASAVHAAPSAIARLRVAAGGCPHSPFTGAGPASSSTGSCAVSDSHLHRAANLAVFQY